MQSSKPSTLFKMASRLPLSVYILTGKNSRTVERALKSVSGWAEEVVVVDSMQEEATSEIGRRYATKFLQREWSGFRSQYRFAAENCSCDWRMFIDADEEVSPALRLEIEEVLRREASLPDGAHSAYEFPRKTFFLGKWIEHGAWIHDQELRLYFRNSAEWSAGLHSALRPRGNVICLKNHIRHYSYRNISDWIGKMDHYTDVSAELSFERGKKPSPFSLVFHPLWYFLKNYIFRRGFLDGIPGFIVYASGGFYVFMKYAKLWERQRNLNGGKDGDA